MAYVPVTSSERRSCPECRTYGGENDTVRVYPPRKSGSDDRRRAWLTAGLPRSYEAVVRGRVKFRVGRIVYLSFSRDETLMGFAFPKEEREAALETYPDKFLRPRPSDMRYQWLVVRLEALDEDELRELVFDAWRMVVPKKLAALSDDELLQHVEAS